MEKLFIGDVFKDTGVPEYTFVEPSEYIKTKVAVKTMGKGLIIEGPSGIGKTTSIKKIISELNIKELILSARKTEDLELIDLLLEDSKNVGMVIIDDFHLLSLDRRKALANLLKTSADENRIDIKLILVGINKAGNGLIELSSDLNNRIDTIRYESNPKSKIIELIEKGEEKLNIEFQDKKSIAEKVEGSFHMTQILCKEMCIIDAITETQEKKHVIQTSVTKACDNKTEELGRVYNNVARTFAIGNKMRREGRAPYFHLLKWLSESKEWALEIALLYVKEPDFKLSISQIVEKGHLKNLLDKNEELRSNIHYDDISKILTIEDPKFMFYLKNLNWSKFAKEIGFINAQINKKYDFALSFAGEIRDLSEKLSEILSNEYHYNVFYDMNEQSEILGRNLDEYFKPIYSSDTEYVVLFLDDNYAKKVWTVFESTAFKERFSQDEVIPVIINKTTINPTDILHNKGFITIDFEKEIEPQIQNLASLLDVKLKNKRMVQKYQNQ